LDVDPDWRGIAERIEDELGHYETVIGPAFEEGGHEHHNSIASILDFHCITYVEYLSYVRGHGRSTDGTEVVPTAEERMLKDVALACYKSQAVFPPTAPWFDPVDQREFVL